MFNDTKLIYNKLINLINLIKIVANSGMIKHYIDIQVKDLGKQKKQSIFNQ